MEHAEPCSQNEARPLRRTKAENETELQRGWELLHARSAFVELYLRDVRREARFAEVSAYERAVRAVRTRVIAKENEARPQSRVVRRIVARIVQGPRKNRDRPARGIAIRKSAVDHGPR
jgi:hypothetical protein